MPFSKIKTNNPDLDRVQDNIGAAVRGFEERPFGVNTVLVEGISLSTSNVAVPHGLGRPPRGWLIVKSNAGVTPYTDTAHAIPDSFIYLKAPAAATVSLLFF